MTSCLKVMHMTEIYQPLKGPFPNMYHENVKLMKMSIGYLNNLTNYMGMNEKRKNGTNMLVYLSRMRQLGGLGRNVVQD